MTNKPILSVERELLERIAKPLKVWADKPYRTKAILELRALLDKPAYPDRLCHADKGAHPYICGCLKGDDEAQRRYDEHHSKAIQHQGEPVAICRLWNEGGSGERTSVEFINGPCADGTLLYAEQQGEPVRWERMSKMGDGTWWPCANKEEADEAVKCGYTVRPLYAEQPAPVAVVMPERKHIPAANCPERINAQGWNACLDAYARLNGVKP